MTILTKSLERQGQYIHWLFEEEFWPNLKNREEFDGGLQKKRKRKKRKKGKKEKRGRREKNKKV